MSGASRSRRMFSLTLPTAERSYLSSSKNRDSNRSAAASIVDQEVTQVVEDVVGGAEGIKNIDSKSENGRSTINV